MSRIWILSVGRFLASAQFFLILFIISPYLATVVPAAVSGLAVSLGAIGTLLLFPLMPKLVRRFSSQRLAVALGVFQLSAMLGLAVSPGPLFAILLAAFAFGNAPFIGYQLDLLLEGSVTDEGMTGRIRTIFLTAANSALVLAPLVAGFLLNDHDQYALIFLLSAVTLLPFILLMASVRLPQPVAHPEQRNILSASRCLLGDKDLCAVALVYAVLQFFFRTTPFYIPLYLHTVLGISWSELGWMLAVMSLPFMLLEYPTGWFADTRFGDKRFMMAGFVIAGLSLTAVGLITTETSIPTILGILLLTSIGGALVEATSESHFFRRVSAADTLTVSLFRMLRPFGALTAPLVASLLLLTISFGTFFLVIGLFVALAGLAAALHIQDARPGEYMSARVGPPFPPQGAS